MPFISRKLLATTLAAAAFGAQKGVARIRFLLGRHFRQPLDDAVFARRLAEAERAAVEEPVARPVVDRLDLLVLRLGQRL